MLRFAPEMNGDWLPVVDGRQRQPPRRLRRRVAARPRALPPRRARRNAVWVWNPIAAYDGADAAARACSPARRDVDWLAVDGYNWGDTRAWGWQSYADIFAPTLRAARARSRPARPVMIAETGSAPDPRKAAGSTDTLAARPRRRRRRARLVRVRQGDRLAPRRRPDGRAAAAAVLRTPGWRVGGDLAAVERAVNRRR